MRDGIKKKKSDHNSRIDPAEENGFDDSADGGDVPQREGDKDARRDHDGAIRGRGERVEERDVRVRRRGRRRRHPDVRIRETMTEGEGAPGDKRTPRGLPRTKKKKKRNNQRRATSASA